MALEMRPRRNRTPWTYFVVKQSLWEVSNLVKAIIHQTTAILASLVTISRLIRLSLLRKDRNAFFRSVKRKGQSILAERATILCSMACNWSDRTRGGSHRGAT